MALYSNDFTPILGVDSILEVIRRFEANYPETLHTAYIINGEDLRNNCQLQFFGQNLKYQIGVCILVSLFVASRVFAMLFALMKPFISARTLSKVKIYSSPSTWKPVLLKELPPDQIPSEFGGTRIGGSVSASPGQYFSHEVSMLFFVGLDWKYEHYARGRVCKGRAIKSECWSRTKARARVQRESPGDSDPVSPIYC
jgi:hypothetical protein